MLYKSRSILQKLCVISLASLALGLSACTVQPLYSSGNGADVESSVAAQLQTVSVEDQSTRDGQLVRNQLIFLLGRGQGQPGNPQYVLSLTSVAVTTSAASIQTSQFRNDQPTAGRVQMRGIYALKNDTGEVLTKGTRIATASYDAPDQGFARDSAEQDAKARAARELAEQIYLATAQAISRN